jgi:hypothetical protein
MWAVALATISIDRSLSNDTRKWKQYKVIYNIQRLPRLPRLLSPKPDNQVSP